MSPPSSNLDRALAHEPDWGTWSLTDCARHRCALLLGSGSEKLLLVAEPVDADRLAWAHSSHDIADILYVTPSAFDAWLGHCEARLDSSSIDSETQRSNALAQEGAEVLSLSRLGSDESPAVKVVNTALYEALRLGASDVHLEMDAEGMGVKFRLDGVLSFVRRVTGTELASQVISRIKVMSQLDIAERRVPQDGRLQIVHAQRPVDVRVSIMPSIHGEDAVLRILDRQHLASSLDGLTLAGLGFSPSLITGLHGLCRRPHGMLLVTGPTGSGKTTTLYAAIAETHHPRDKIITIEDPVEYQLPGVLQIPVNERKGLTFARGLRSILRHDPDKILIGEIRDAETAQIAVQSALTGHLVFTTVHANNVFDVLGRFMQFDIDPYMFGAAINGVLAQRLLRRVCLECSAVDARSGVRSQASGCEKCRGTGYAGRLAIGELLIMDTKLRSLFVQRASLKDLEDEARKTGWLSMKESAKQLVMSGHTTQDEVDRVVG